jgi:hypothetical protein
MYKQEGAMMRKELGGLALALTMNVAACISVSSGGSDGGAPSGGGMDLGAGSGDDMAMTLVDLASNADMLTSIPNGGCTGRQCQINYYCPPGSGPTTLTGTVMIPAGNLPIHNAIVYIPSGAVPAAPSTGPSCNRCDSVVPGDAAASTTTDINGKFTLSYAPSGQNIPLVVQVGKWRRVVTIPSVPECTTTTLTTAQTRLPKNQIEGNIPKMALTTGAFDALECLLRSQKLGLDDSEFTNPSGNGRVNLFTGGQLYNATQGTGSYTAALGGADFPLATTFWNDAANNFNNYDIVLFSCEGTQNAADKTAQAHKNLDNFLNAGGRVFASHWQNVWISDDTTVAPPTPIKSVATFLSNGGYQNDTTSISATINQSFAKGKALAQWLQNNGATSTLGQLPINYSRVTLTGRDATLTQSWAEFSDPNAAADGVIAPASQYFTFNTPVGASAANQCGQMVFTDIHVSGGKSDVSAPSKPFPSGCTSTGLTPQEKALIFLLFDLSSCLQPN